MKGLEVSKNQKDTNWSCPFMVFRPSCKTRRVRNPRRHVTCCALSDKLVRCKGLPLPKVTSWSMVRRVSFDSHPARPIPLVFLHKQLDKALVSNTNGEARGGGTISGKVCPLSCLCGGEQQLSLAEWICRRHMYVFHFPLSFFSPVANVQ